MKKPILAALAGLSLTLAFATAVTPIFAQAVPGQARLHAGGRLKKIANALGLTDAQKSQIRPILKSSWQQAKAIKSDTTLTPEAKRAQLKALHQSTQQQIAGILTPDQQAKLAAMKHNHQK